MTKSAVSTIKTTSRRSAKESDWPKLNKKLKTIWDQPFWNAQATKIELGYWELIKDKVPNVKPPKELRPTEHRIEAFVRKLSRKKGIGNLHVGLTSSDLEDNVRTKRLDESIKIIEQAICTVFVNANLMPVEETDLIAYTHLMPAGITNLWDRMAPAFIARVVPPKPRYKGIGGALGNLHIQKRLGLHDTQLLIPPIADSQQWKHQTGDHIYEFEVASWITLTAALYCKIANDYRQMYAFGQAIPKQKDIGSTAIPGKAPNPWRFEKAAGLAKLLFCLPGQVADILADCLLERTLTNQAALNQLFERAFADLLKVCQTLNEAISLTRIVDQTKLCEDPKLHSEEQMLKLVLQGIPRELAHKQINETSRSI